MAWCAGALFTCGWGSLGGRSLVAHAPRRAIPPGLQNRARPFRRFITVANVAGIGNLVGVGLRRRNEAEGVGVDVHVRNRLLDFWHVAGDALAARAARLVTRVFLDGGGMRPVLRVRPVTREAHLAGRLTQLRRVPGPVHVVATKASDAAI